MTESAWPYGRNPLTIAVVGLGKIGLPLAVEYARRGHHVIGCDANPRVVDHVNAGRAPSDEEPGLDAGIAAARRDGRLRATAETPAAVRGADAVVVIVPVAVDAAHDIDFHALDAATHDVAVGLSRGTLVLYETTLPVGTTDRRLRPLLEEASGLSAAHDFHLAYSPERVSVGHIARDLATYPKVVGGVTPAATNAAVVFYQLALDAPILRMASADAAEFVKLIETTYRDVNIALANEFAAFADTHGLDIRAAIAAANTQPYSHIHTPGVGVGGHCIPVYPYFLLRDAGDGLTLPRQARRVNDAMAEYALRRMEAVIGSLGGCTVLILGATYRGDVRESAFSTARLLRDALLARGARPLVLDPLYSERALTDLGYEPLRPEDVESVDAIILQAGHSAFRRFGFHPFTRCRAVLDGRGVLSREAVERAGLRYLAIGDGGLRCAELHE
jgi:nucleotide sugar dehydrogenase